ncbi:hypothetical protein EYC84_007302 [Monilinia fructicola]|uniref:Uncharacterized protein n=1 Tax=Monilinia fructicola TaxID=38448 RepID=A0A5M9KA00_MONFR|nr:hypothetical protein EYC84_007302 [Monilinia fructicola]
MSIGLIIWINSFYENCRLLLHVMSDRPPSYLARNCNDVWYGICLHVWRGEKKETSRKRKRRSKILSISISIHNVGKPNSTSDV